MIVRSAPRLKLAFLMSKTAVFALFVYLGASHLLKIDWTGARTGNSVMHARLDVWLSHYLSHRPGLPTLR